MKDWKPEALTAQVKALRSLLAGATPSKLMHSGIVARHSDGQQLLSRLTELLETAERLEAGIQQIGNRRLGA